MKSYPWKMTQNDFRRVVWMLNSFLIAGKLSLQELNERWQRSTLNESGEKISRFTFMRWKETVETVFDLMFMLDEHDRYRYHIVNPEVLDKDTVLNHAFHSISIDTAMMAVIGGGKLLINRLAPCIIKGSDPLMIQAFAFPFYHGFHVFFITDRTDFTD